ncbi:MAG: hypothetical protein L3J23_09210 [Flavobacteriaceae bacterium]|nr:hypothetical protein [Flavobacteriaceae bacterium]
MKKLLLFIFVLLFTISSFAQEKSFEENITQLMYAKNGMSAIENITPELTKTISANNKTKFSAKLDVLKTEFIQNTKAQLKEEYTNSQIVAIYTEYYSDKTNYTDQTNDFFSKYRKLKEVFFRDAKLLYVEYQ